MTNKLNRRNLLKASVGITGFFMSPTLLRGIDESSLVESSFDKTTHQSLARHGNLKDNHNETVLWSIMKVNEKSNFLSEIEEILSNYKYKSEISYRSNDKFKYGSCRALINLVNNHSSVEFSMYYIRNANTVFGDLNPTEYQAGIAKVFQSFQLMNDVSNVLIAKSENRYGPSDLLKETCDNAISGNLITVNAKIDRILQVNNLISGLVYSFINDSETGNQVKLNLRDDFDSKYSISKNISTDFTIGNIEINRI